MLKDISLSSAHPRWSYAESLSIPAFIWNLGSGRPGPDSPPARGRPSCHLMCPERQGEPMFYRQEFQV